MSLIHEYYRNWVERQMNEAEVSCVVRWSQPHVKLPLLQYFTVTLSFHVKLSCVVRTESFLPLGVRRHIFTSISLFVQSCSCEQGAKPGSAVCVNIGNTSPSIDRFYSTATCFALLIFVPPFGVRNGLSQTDMSRRYEKSRAVLCVCHCSSAVKRRRTLKRPFSGVWKDITVRKI